MTATIVLNCITRAPNGSIAKVGGIENVGGTQKHYTEAEAIAAIEAGSFRFEVHDAGGHCADVRVCHHGQHRFLETHRDGVKTDNLGNLPLCRHIPIAPTPLPYRPAPVHRGHCVFSGKLGDRK